MRCDTPNENNKLQFSGVLKCWKYHVDEKQLVTCQLSMFSLLYSIGCLLDEE